MPIEVELPDGTIVEFPDGTSRGTMEMALARYRQPNYADLQRRAAALPQSDGTTGNFMEDAAANFGGSFVRTAEGLGQAAGLVDEAQVAERRQRDQPLMDSRGGFWGGLAGDVSQIAVPVPGVAAAKLTQLAGKAAPYIGAGLRGAAFGGAQGTLGDESRGQNAVVGGLLGVAGQGLAHGAKAMASGVRSRMDDAGRALAQQAEAYGIKLGVPDLSQNPLVRTMASQLERLPFSGAGARARANQRALNEQVGATFGAKADKITPDVFATAKAKLGNVFETLSGRNNLALTTQHVTQVKQLIDEASRLGGADTARMVRGWANELMGKVDAKGAVPGRAYQSFDSRLGKALKSGGEPAHYLGQLREIVRGAMDDSISAGDRAAWQAVRKQWAALKTVEPLVAKSTTGDISAASLMGRVTADNAGKARMAAGTAGVLGDLARIGQRFLKESPNSGTADRALVNLAVGGGLFGAQNQGWIEPETAMKIGGGLLANRAALKALNSRALSAGGSKTLNGVARIVRPAPRLLPAAGPRILEIGVAGGRPATLEDIERDAEIVRRHRQQRGLLNLP